MSVNGSAERGCVVGKYNIRTVCVARIYGRWCLEKNVVQFCSGSVVGVSLG